MSILSWDKPARAVPSKKHAETYVADGAPPGAYVPNMSREDVLKWKAKLVGHKASPPHPQVEIRRNHLVIVVSLGDGYRYKHFGSSSANPWLNTKGINLHIASSGPQMMTFAEFDQMVQAIAEAREYLEKYNETS